MLIGLKKTFFLLLLFLFFLDYSSNMSEEQLRQSHIICESVFSTLRGKDRIGFMVFNDSVHQQFALQQKDHYEMLIRKKLKTMQLNTRFFLHIFYKTKKVEGAPISTWRLESPALCSNWKTGSAYAKTIKIHRVPKTKKIKNTFFSAQKEAPNSALTNLK